MLSPRGQLREARWRENGAQPPYTHCVRRDMPAGRWCCWDVPERVIRALKAIDPWYELIHDPLTLDPGDRRPAFFLYRRTIHRHGPLDAMELQLPVQAEPDWVWPEGGPRPPGMWFIRELRQRDKSRRAGTQRQIEGSVWIEKMDRMRDAERIRRKPLVDFEDDINEQLAPYLIRRRCTQPARGRHRPNWSGKKARPIIIPVTR